MLMLVVVVVALASMTCARNGVELTLSRTPADCWRCDATPSLKYSDDLGYARKITPNFGCGISVVVFFYAPIRRLL